MRSASSSPPRPPRTTPHNRSAISVHAGLAPCALPARCLRCLLTHMSALRELLATDRPSHDASKPICRFWSWLVGPAQLRSPREHDGLRERLGRGGAAGAGLRLPSLVEIDYWIRGFRHSEQPTSRPGHHPGPRRGFARLARSSRPRCPNRWESPKSPKPPSRAGTRRRPDSIPKSTQGLRSARSTAASNHRPAPTATSAALRFFIRARLPT